MALAKQKHYAKALVELEKDEGCFAELVADIESVAEKLKNDKDLKKILLSRHITLSEKKKAAENVFQDFISAKTYNFLFLLIKNGELADLKKMADKAKKINMQREGIAEIVAETAVKMSDSHIKKLTQIMEKRLNKKILLKNILNPKLIAGMRLQIDDTEFDASIAGKISRLKDKISSLQ